MHSQRTWSKPNPNRAPERVAWAKSRQDDLVLGIRTLSTVDSRWAAETLFLHWGLIKSHLGRGGALFAVSTLDRLDPAGEHRTRTVTQSTVICVTF